MVSKNKFGCSVWGENDTPDMERKCYPGREGNGRTIGENKFTNFSQILPIFSGDAMTKINDIKSGLTVVGICGGTGWETLSP